MNYHLYLAPHSGKTQDPRIAISTVGAAGPTARPAHALAHFIKADCYTAAPGFIFLGGYNPTNPLIAREWRDIFPYRSRRDGRNEDFPQIHRHFVYHTAGDLVLSPSKDFGHSKLFNRIVFRGKIILPHEYFSKSNG